MFSAKVELLQKAQGKLGVDLQELDDLQTGSKRSLTDLRKKKNARCQRYSSDPLSDGVKHVRMT